MTFTIFITVLLIALELFGIGFALMLTSMYFEQQGGVSTPAAVFTYAVVIVLWPLFLGFAFARRIVA